MAYQDAFKSPNVMSSNQPSGREEDIQRETLTVDLEEEELVRRINDYLTEGEELHNKIKEIQEQNRNYWVGNHPAKDKDEDFKAKIIDNRIFLSKETIIANITDNPPQPFVHPPVKNREGKYLPEDERKDLRRMIQGILEDEYEKQDMRWKTQMFARHYLTFRLGVLKTYYDTDTEGIVTEWVRPQRLVIDPHGPDPDWIGEWMKKSLAELIDEFPDKKDKILQQARVVDESSRKDLATKVDFIEFWFKYMDKDGNRITAVAWKYKDVILDVMKNPNWDWEGEGVFGTVKDEETGEPIREEVERYHRNHMEKPEFPYVFFPPVFSTGLSMYDETSLQEQAIPLQDGVNKRKNQISDLTDRAGGKIVGSGDAIKKGELARISNDPEEHIWIKTGDPRKAIMHIPGPDVPAATYNDLADTKNEIDNIMGTHETTRGEAGRQETATGRQLMKMGDNARFAVFVRAMEKALSEIYNHWLQLMKIYYTNEHYTEVAGRGGAQKMFKFTRDDIVDGVEVRVKSGSTKPVDKAAIRAEAMQLAKSGHIDPISLFEDLDKSRPKKRARRLFLWSTNPQILFKEEGEPLPQQAVQQQQAQQQPAQGQGRKQAPAQGQSQQQPRQKAIGGGARQQQPEAGMKKAILHIQALDEGESVSPFEPDSVQDLRQHIAIHTRYLSEKQEGMSPEVKRAHAQHIRQENNLLKRFAQGG